MFLYLFIKIDIKFTSASGLLRSYFHLVVSGYSMAIECRMANKRQDAIKQSFFGCRQNRLLLCLNERPTQFYFYDICDEREKISSMYWEHLVVHQFFVFTTTHTNTFSYTTQPFFQLDFAFKLFMSICCYCSHFLFHFHFAYETTHDSESRISNCHHISQILTFLQLSLLSYYSIIA